LASGLLGNSGPIDDGATVTTPRYSESLLCQIRLLLEELCCDLCRFAHTSTGECPPENVVIDREFHLGLPGAFADIRVAAPGKRPYFVEIKYGYSKDQVLRSLKRKYGTLPDGSLGSRVILVWNADSRSDCVSLQADLAGQIHPNLEIEIWDERQLLEKMGKCFRTTYQSITPDNLLDLREVVDRAKGFDSFGGSSFEDYDHDPLKAELQWHFGFWRLRQLRETGRPTPRDILPPGTYRGVVVVLADLCSFSSFVRDTPDEEIIRESLTSFYSKSRYQIINSGGMLYQFVGDEVIGCFGLPIGDPTDAARALQTAIALVKIGRSVSNHWQRRIDRVQTAGGVHIGIAVGDMQIVSLRPFSRTHMGAIGDCINIAARLTAAAGQSEIVISNACYGQLPTALREGFRELEPIDARNVGRIKAWKLALDSV
jgi:class 3 adenylate cyclase